MSNNSYTSFEEEHAANKREYLSLLKEIISKKNNQTIQEVVLDHYNMHIDKANEK